MELQPVKGMRVFHSLRNASGTITNVHSSIVVEVEFDNEPNEFLQTDISMIKILPVYIPAESLTKENFWNELYEKYPKGMKVFCDWIDAYKKAIGWDNLFRADHHKLDELQSEDGFMNQLLGNPAPKYHDLPFAMQIGIWIAFVYWLANHTEEAYHTLGIEILPLDASDRTWASAIIDTIKSLNVNLS